MWDIFQLYLKKRVQTEREIALWEGKFTASVETPKKIITFDLTTAGDWDCVAAVERLPALHHSVDFIFLSFGIMGFSVEL